MGNPDYLACASFIDALRVNKRPEADEDKAWNEGIAVCVANQAIAQGQRLKLDENLAKAAPA
jgi:hypothetical protein